MKKKITLTIIAGCLAAAFSMVVVMSGFTSGYSDSDYDAFEAAVSAKNAMMQTGVIQPEVLEQLDSAAQSGAISKEEQLLSIAKEQSAPKYDEYFASERAQQLEEKHEAAMENLSEEEITIGGGTCDNEMLKSEDISSTEKMITTSEVSWLKTIYRIDNNYIVSLIFNRDYAVYRMVKEDGSWMVGETVGDQKEFAPSDYESSKGTFHSLEEALKFAMQLNVEQENPF